ncbi:hypothetical protein CXIVA_01800 [Clostridium sp. SY8519]|jgi:hypothetical protein|uniref:major capsid protein n=1 Tax=Clostridium sp. (strain SY8519) TaxID=1042156 RepID=UPI0002171F7A|nr:major capsid protein [Clostridium sp. SY8519]BAK46147.1 hypothetical protein CXIVA_01800 [Clostridium sp. SY8519]
MPGTNLSNVIVPEIWVPYVVEKTAEKSAFITSGMIQNDPKFDQLASQAGPVVNMPFWADLTGDSENIEEGKDLTIDGIQAKKDVAPILRRAKAWSETDLSGMMTGDDPSAVIGDLVADFWARDMQKEAIAILNGIFGTSDTVTSAPLKDNILDITGLSGAKAAWSGAAFIDAEQMLGDAKTRLTGIVMHSATEAALKKQNLIETVQPSNDVSFGVYQGKRVIVDDGCPVDASKGVYTTYLFGDGAFALGNGSPADFVAAETDRDKRKGSGIDYLINRKQYLLHPRGCAFTSADTKAEGPSRAQLMNPANWKQVYETKNIRLVAFKHKLA